MQIWPRLTLRRLLGVLMLALALFVALPQGGAAADAVQTPGQDTIRSAATGASNPSNAGASVDGVYYGFPFLGDDIDEAKMIANAFMFQMYLFTGVSGAPTGSLSTANFGQSLKALQYLAMTATMIGALLIVFFPKYQKAPTILTWLLLVCITIFTPLSSKLLFYPIVAKDNFMVTQMGDIPDGVHSSKKDCTKSAISCGLTIQLVAVDIASRMETIVRDIFRSLQWTGLMQRMQAEARLRQAPDFVLSREWLLDNATFVDRCPNRQNLADYLPNSTVRAPTTSPAPAKKLSEIWGEISEIYATPSGAKAPPVIIFPTEDPTKEIGSGGLNWTSEESQKYLDALLLLYREYGGTGTAPDQKLSFNGGNNTIKVSDALDKMANNGFFSVRIGTVAEFKSSITNWTLSPLTTAPGFFFARADTVGESSSSLGGGAATTPASARRLYGQEKADSQPFAEPLVDIKQNEKGDNKNDHRNTFLAVDARVKGEASNDVVPSDWEGFIRIYGKIKDMPVGYGYVTEKAQANTLALPTIKIEVKKGLSCYELGKSVIKTAITALVFSSSKDSKQTANYFDRLVSMLGGTGDSTDEAAASIPDNITVSNITSMLPADLAKNPEKRELVMSMAVFMNEVVRLARAQPAYVTTTEASEKEKLKRVAMVAALIQMMQDSTSKVVLSQSSKKDRGLENTVTGDLARQSVWGFSVGGLAFDVGKVLAAIGAWFTGPLAYAYIQFLVVFIQLAMFALILATPFLFVIGLFVPSVAAGMLSIAFLGTLVLKFVPVTLLLVNGVAGMIYDMIPFGAGPEASTMRNFMILGMAGLYTNLVGLTLYLLFKIGDPQAFIGRLGGLDSAAKEAAETGMNAVKTGAAMALAVASGGAGGVLGAASMVANKMGSDGEVLAQGIRAVQRTGGAVVDRVKGAFGKGGPKGKGDGEGDGAAETAATGEDGRPLNTTGDDNAQFFNGKWHTQEELFAMGLGGNIAGANGLYSDGKGNQFSVGEDNAGFPIIKVKSAAVDTQAPAPEKPAPAGAPDAGKQPSTPVAAQQADGGAPQAPAAGGGDQPKPVAPAGGGAPAAEAGAQQAQQAASAAAEGTGGTAAESSSAPTQAAGAGQTAAASSSAGGETTTTTKKDEKKKEEPPSVPSPDRSSKEVLDRVEEVRKARAASDHSTRVQKTAEAIVTADEMLARKDLSAADRKKLQEYRDALMKGDYIGERQGDLLRSLADRDKDAAWAKLRTGGDKLHGGFLSARSWGFMGASMLSGMFGSLKGAAGGAGSIPFVGTIIKETLNEFLEAPQRVRGVRAQGGVMNALRNSSDAQRLAFYNKAIGSVGGAEQYRAMEEVGGFQSSVNLARQAANEAVNRARSHYEALMMKTQDTITSGDRKPGATVGYFSAADLRGIGRAEALQKVNSVYVEAAEMSDKGGIKIQVTNPKWKEGMPGEDQFTTATVQKSVRVLDELVSTKAAKAVSSEYDGLLVTHYGVVEKKLMRGVDWDPTRDMRTSGKATAAFSTLDVDTDYMVGGHLNMVEKKAQFFGLRGRYAALVEMRNEGEKAVEEYLRQGENLDAARKIVAPKVEQAMAGFYTANMVAGAPGKQEIVVHPGGWKADEKDKFRQRTEYTMIKKEAVKQLEKKGKMPPVDLIVEEARLSGYNYYHDRRKAAQQILQSEAYRARETSVKYFTSALLAQVPVLSSVSSMLTQPLEVRNRNNEPNKGPKVVEALVDELTKGVMKAFNLNKNEKRDIDMADRMTAVLGDSFIKALAKNDDVAREAFKIGRDPMEPKERIATVSKDALDVARKQVADNEPHLLSAFDAAFADVYKDNQSLAVIARVREPDERVRTDTDESNQGRKKNRKKVRRVRRQFGRGQEDGDGGDDSDE